MDKQKIINNWKKTLYEMNVNAKYFIFIFVISKLLFIALIIDAIYLSKYMVRESNGNCYFLEGYSLYFNLLITFLVIILFCFLISFILSIVISVKCFKHENLFLKSSANQALSVVGIFFPIVEFIFCFILISNINKSLKIINNSKEKQEDETVKNTDVVELKNNNSQTDLKTNDYILDFENKMHSFKKLYNEGTITIDDFNTLKQETIKQLSAIESTKNDK